MKKQNLLVATMLMIALAACGKSEQATPAAENTAPKEMTAPPAAAVSEIVPGLTMRMLRAGDGETVAAGDIAVVHYTGWLFDETAENNRGQKFDSSVDRGQHFQFPLGAGRVIKGWDAGVAGMQVGEVRELTIAPEMGYGARGAGDVIPPGATLVFEVELAGINAGADPR